MKAFFLLSECFHIKKHAVVIKKNHSEHSVNSLCLIGVWIIQNSFSVITSKLLLLIANSRTVEKRWKRDISKPLKNVDSKFTLKNNQAVKKAAAPAMYY